MKEVFVTYGQHASRRLRLTLLVGLIVTAAVGVAPVIDLVSTDTVTAHVRHAYPAWPASYVAGERTVLTAYLVAVGLFGAAGWAWSLARARRRPIHGSAIVLFAFGAAVALAHSSVGLAQYE